RGWGRTIVFIYVVYLFSKKWLSHSEESIIFRDAGIAKITLLTFKIRTTARHRYKSPAGSYRYKRHGTHTPVPVPARRWSLWIWSLSPLSSRHRCFSSGIQTDRLAYPSSRQSSALSPPIYAHLPLPKGTLAVVPVLVR